MQKLTNGVKLCRLPSQDVEESPRINSTCSVSTALPNEPLSYPTSRDQDKLKASRYKMASQHMLHLNEAYTKAQTKPAQ